MGRTIFSAIMLMLGVTPLLAIRGIGIRLRYRAGKFTPYIYIFGISIPFRFKKSKNKKQREKQNAAEKIIHRARTLRIKRLCLHIHAGLADSPAATAFFAGITRIAAEALLAAFAADICEKAIDIRPDFGKDVFSAELDCIIIQRTGKIIKEKMKKAARKHEPSNRKHNENDAGKHPRDDRRKYSDRREDNIA